MFRDSKPHNTIYSGWEILPPPTIIGLIILVELRKLYFHTFNPKCFELTIYRMYFEFVRQIDCRKDETLFFVFHCKSESLFWPHSASAFSECSAESSQRLGNLLW